jgi:hypothetical protein
MPENETLDLRRSARWNQTRRLIQAGASPDELAPEVLRVLDVTLRKVAKLIPIGPLIQEVQSPNGDPRALLPECRGAWEYAQALIQLARQCQTAADAVLCLCKHLVAKFFDQERQALPIDAAYSKLAQLNQTEAATCRALRPNLEQLAQTFAEHQTHHRQRSVPPIARQSQQELLQLSLR